MSLREYRRNWLMLHQGRTEGWLRDRLRDGFDDSAGLQTESEKGLHSACIAGGLGRRDDVAENVVCERHRTWRPRTSGNGAGIRG